MKKIFTLFWCLIAVILLTGCVGSAGNIDIESASVSSSFAIITDLHIGYGIPNYYPGYSAKPGFAWLDKAEGYPGDNDQNKHCAEKLQAAVETIIKNKDRYNIKFVVVLGDIADTAERSEFETAQRILSKLNDNGIPCLPVNGNHDVWPYTQPLNNFNPEDRSMHEDIADFAAGDRFFEEVFWDNNNAKNIQLINNLLGQSWERNKNPVRLPDVSLDANLQNFGFCFREISFLGIDLAPRAKTDSNPIDGIAYPGGTLSNGISNPQGSFSKYYEQTKNFSKVYTVNHLPKKKTLVIFSHYRIPQNTLNDLVNVMPDNYEQIYTFFGHEHNVNDQEQTLIYEYSRKIKFYSICTEDLAGIDFPFTSRRTNEPIRVVKIYDNNSIDYSTFLPLDSFITPAPIQTVTSSPPLKNSATTYKPAITSPTATIPSSMVKTIPKTTSLPPSTSATISTRQLVKKSLERWQEKNKYALSDFGSHALIFDSISENEYVVLGDEAWAFISAMPHNSFILYNNQISTDGWVIKLKRGYFDWTSITGLAVKDIKTVYARIGSYSMMYTTDGGQTWKSDLSLDPKLFPK